MAEPLRAYLNSLPTEEQESFAKRSGTTVAYIRKVLSTGQRFGERLVIAFERESSGAVRCESMRSDVDWAYIRGSTLLPSEVASRKRA